MSATLIKALQNPDIYPYAVDEITCIETHVSWVLLTGPYAYKIKKPLKLSFLDYSTLERRRHFCEEELRLNQHNAAELYEKVVAIYGSENQPQFEPSGEPIEYAVCMRQFDHQQELDVLLADGRVDSDLIDQTANELARMHREAPAAEGDTFGSREAVMAPVQECLDDLRRETDEEQEQYQILSSWCAREAQRCHTQFEQRRRDGFIRVCHGDLHLRNLVLHQGQVLAFDRIEFDPNLYNIDIISDLAFLFMDLLEHGRQILAWRLLNHWLDATGDYQGAALLPYYTVYRALVRAKVAALRLQQLTDVDEQTSVLEEYQRYIALALEWTRQSGALLIMCGLSGSGKSHVSGMLMQELPGIRMRSDRERKRLFVDNGDDLYTPAITEALYKILGTHADALLGSGLRVIVDAAFLKKIQRQQFHQMALNAGVMFLTVLCTAPESVLRQRLQQRQQSGEDPSDADTAVLDLQLHSAEMPESEENCLRVDTDSEAYLQTLAQEINELLKTD